ncbi:helix-turn-helix domain-containing protein [Pedobacter sp. SYP-B3415]|uniref:helix-turn-helix domain-containing protein n=1 Tax=Pedobacter sp. SYP-B3415 TaxID=2496641 RepID=UPI00101D565E|nr:helix-turn-helix transcriptional regulator [Pedobacter sp. SYP-B3415]
MQKKTLKEFRLSKQLSQQELANLSGISLRTIQRIEKGESPGSPYVIRTLCTALGVSPEELLVADAASLRAAPDAAAEPEKFEENNAPVGSGNRYVKFINFSALLVLLFPFANLVAVPAVYLLSKRNIRAANDQDDAHRIISYQIIWSAAVASLLILTPLADYLIWHIGDILEIPLFLWVYLAALFVHLFLTLSIARRLSKKLNVSTSFPNFF